MLKLTPGVDFIVPLRGPQLTNVGNDLRKRSTVKALVPVRGEAVQVPSSAGPPPPDASPMQAHHFLEQVLPKFNRKILGRHDPCIEPLTVEKSDVLRLIGSDDADYPPLQETISLYRTDVHVIIGGD